MGVIILCVSASLRLCVSAPLREMAWVCGLSGGLDGLVVRPTREPLARGFVRGEFFFLFFGEALFGKLCLASPLQVVGCQQVSERR
jgi:hypothetical protein